MAKKYREGHIPIPGWAYIIIGAIVAVYSRIVQGSDPDNAAMTIFFWLGIVLVAFGVGKLLLKREEKVVDRDLRKEARQAKQEPIQQEVIACKACGAKNWSTSNFCHKCGVRLR